MPAEWECLLLTWVGWVLKGVTIGDTVSVGTPCRLMWVSNAL